MNCSPALGIDMEDVTRFADLDRKEDASFLENVYTDRELDYCFSKAEPSQHLAGRFVAKEATFKATEQIESVRWTNMTGIEIQRRGDNEPPELHGDCLDNLTSTLSISHTTDAAIAIVLLLDPRSNNE